MAGGGICGPVIGAALSEYVSWRWIGWINLPIVALGFGLSFFFLRLRPIEQSFRSKLLRLDWIGMLLFALGSTAFSLPLSWAGSIYSWSSWKTVLPLASGVIILVGFSFYEKRPVQPIFPYRIFQNVTAFVTITGAIIHGMLLYSVMLYAPLFYQVVMLETPLKSAVSVLPASVSIVVFSILSAITIEVVRRYRWVVICSWVFSALGVGLWALWHSDSTLALTASLQIIAGIGIGTHMLVYITHGTSSENTDSGVALLGVTTRPHGLNPGFQKEARPNAVPLKEHKPVRVTAEATRNDRSLGNFIGLYRADLHQSIPHGSADGISRKFVQCFIQSE